MKTSPFARKLLLATFGISGAVALMFEVVWTRSLSLVLGSTVYAVSTMLTAFMSGLALGSYLGGVASDRYKNPLLLYGLCELGIGIFGILTVPLINALPPLYFLLYSKFHMNLQMFFILQFAMCLLIMLGPTTLMGATFPLASKARITSLPDMGKEIGTLYSFNTMGAVAGAFSAGFIMIPLLGLKLSTMIGGSLNVCAGLAVAFVAGNRSRTAPLLLAGVFISIALAMGFGGRETGYAYNYYKNGRYQNLKEISNDRVNFNLVFYRDDPHGTVKVFVDRRSSTIFLENGGKIEGSSGKDVPNEILLAYLPLAYLRDAKDFLVIGLGTGMTLNVAKQIVGRAECVEINRSVVDAVQTYFFPGLVDSSVALYLTDARNFLTVTDKRYDVISSEPSYPADSVAANLFTREFFQQASKRLKPGGVFAQWLPYYQMGRRDVTIMVKTFASVFPNVEIWKIPISSDLIMIGSLSPFQASPKEIEKRVAKMNQFPWEMPYVLSKSRRQTREIVAASPRLPMNTDDRPVIEFSVAKRLVSHDFELNP